MTPSKTVCVMSNTKTVIMLVFLSLVLSSVKGSPSQLENDYYGDQASDNGEYIYEDGVQDDIDGQSREQANSISSYSPEIISQSKHLIVDNGLTIRMPCMVDPKMPEGVQIMWTKLDTKNTVIAIGSNVIDDAMIKRASVAVTDKGSSLKIGAAKTEDAGDYKCEVMIENNRPELKHTVSIRAPPLPPSIVSSSLAPVIVEKGQEVTLTCKGKGTPEPSIKWTRKDHRMPSGEDTKEGDVVIFKSVTRKHAGIYRCTASNGHGSGATKEIEVIVRYAPEVEISEVFVHKRMGDEAELVCTVHAFPPATVTWTKGGSPVSQNDRIIISNKGGKHALNFKEVARSDFGEYSCHASNEVGDQRNTKIQLSGHAKPTDFQSSPTGEDDDSFSIEWTSFSLSPIEDFRLEISTLPSGAWETHGPTPPTKLEKPFTWAGKFYLKGLKGATQYRARVTAKNEEGWGKPGPEWNFATKGAEPSVRADCQRLSGSGVMITAVICLVSWVMFSRTGLAY